MSVKFEPPFSVDVMPALEPELPDLIGVPQPAASDLSTKASMPALTPKQAAEARWAALSPEDAWAMLENQPRIAGPWEMHPEYAQRWDPDRIKTYAEIYERSEWHWNAFLSCGRAATKLEAMRAADESLRAQGIMVVGTAPEDA